MAWYYSTTTPPMHACSQLHILPKEPDINLIFLNYVQPIYILKWVIGCGMQFLFVRCSLHLWIGSLIGDENHVYRMEGIHPSTKALIHVVLVKLFLTYREYYSNFLTSKPFLGDFLHLILPRNNMHLCNPLYVVSPLVKLSQILYVGMTCCHNVICTFLD